MHPATDPVDDPFAAFVRLWDSIKAAAPAAVDPHAMTLATVSADGRPSARIVLLRGLTERGFQFFTNYGSRKARELDATPRAALCFDWHWAAQQVRVEGVAERTTPEESDAYFATRPRGSQLGAWASRQSAPLRWRADLEAAYVELERTYAGREVPRPPFWGGYTIVPEVLEFWRAGEYRLHDRIRYTRREGVWVGERLNP